MTGIAELFAELDGRADHHAVMLATVAAAMERQRARWREDKRRQRAAMKRAGKKPDRRWYAERYKNDAAFRERRKAYWRAYSKRKARAP